MTHTRETYFHTVLKNKPEKEQLEILCDEAITRKELETWSAIPYAWTGYAYTSINFSNIREGLDIYSGILSANTQKEMQDLYTMCHSLVPTLSVSTRHFLRKVLENYKQHWNLMLPHWEHIDNILMKKTSHFNGKGFHMINQKHTLSWLYKDVTEWPSTTQACYQNALSDPEAYIEFLEHGLPGYYLHDFHEEFKTLILAPFKTLLQKHEEYPDIWHLVSSDNHFDLALTEKECACLYSLWPFEKLNDFHLHYVKLTPEEENCLKIDPSLTVHQVRKNRPHYEESILVMI